MMSFFKAVGLSLLFMVLFLSTPCMGADGDQTAAKGEGVEKVTAASDAGAGMTDENGTASTGPSIVFVDPNFTFDQVVEGTEVTHDFLFSNKGDAPLHIHKVKTG